MLGHVCINFLNTYSKVYSIFEHTIQRFIRFFALTVSCHHCFVSEFKLFWSGGKNIVLGRIRILSRLKTFQ